jgi:CBS domain-containing protein
VKSYKVKDLMVPLEEYVTIDEEATVFDAVTAIEKSVDNQRKFPHRAILVLDKSNKVIGKLSMLDLIRALEPKYREMQDSSSTSSMKNLGFSKKFMASIMEQFQLLDGALNNITRKTKSMKAKDNMTTLTEHEYTGINDSLNMAIHQLVIGHHQSLLVKGESGEIVGIIRLTDVFSFIHQRMHEHDLE